MPFYQMSSDKVSEADITQAQALVKSAKFDADFTWKLSAGKDLWPSDQEAVVKNIHEQHQNVLDVISMTLDHRRDYLTMDNEHMVRTAKILMARLAISYARLCKEYEQIWSIALHTPLVEGNIRDLLFTGHIDWTFDAPALTVALRTMVHGSEPVESDHERCTNSRCLLCFGQEELFEL